jgi:hypothetical protein
VEVRAERERKKEEEEEREGRRSAEGGGWGWGGAGDRYILHQIDRHSQIIPYRGLLKDSSWLGMVLVCACGTNQVWGAGGGREKERENKIVGQAQREGVSGGRRKSRAAFRVWVSLRCGLS